ncbi:MAG: hypothetical protein ACYCS8_04250 [Acidithiobacillus sp.]
MISQQFANFLDLDRQILSAIMEAMASFTSLSTQTFKSAHIRSELKNILPAPAELYERVRERTKKGVTTVAHR